MPESYLISILQPLLRNPEVAKIVRSQEEGGTITLTATFAKGDMGSVIGKSGETIKAIRYLLKVVGNRQGNKVVVKVTEPDGSPFQPLERKVELTA